VNVLLVDDDVSLLRIFEELLKEEGHSPVLASSGQEAFPILDEMGPPDVMLVDSSMPLMSGAEFLAKVKDAYPAVFNRTHIVGFTAFPKGSSIIRDFETLVTEVVEKPRDIDEFLGFIRRLSTH
jgi:CheY-like chemotaxis protein